MSVMLGGMDQGFAYESGRGVAPAWTYSLKWAAYLALAGAVSVLVLGPLLRAVIRRRVPNAPPDED